MEEQDRLVMRADAGLTVAEDARAFALQLVASRVDVCNLVADMVNAAAGIALEKPGDRGIFAERTQKLDLGVVQFDKDDRHAVCRQIRSEEHTSELQSLMRISYAVYCLKNKTFSKHQTINQCTHL